MIRTFSATLIRDGYPKQHYKKEKKKKKVSYLKGKNYIYLNMETVGGMKMNILSWNNHSLCICSFQNVESDGNILMGIWWVSWMSP